MQSYTHSHQPSNTSLYLLNPRSCTITSTMNKPSVFSVLQRISPGRPKAKQPKSIEPSGLERLPAEILQFIAGQYLPLIFAAALALCNHHMYNVLGTKYMEELKAPGNRHLMAEFLRLFEGDYPKHLLCHSCGRFHTSEAMLGDKSKLRCRAVKLYSPLGFDTAITYHQVQAAINRHLHGSSYGDPEYTSILDPAIVSYVPYLNGKAREYFKHGRIVNNELIMLFQRKFVLWRVGEAYHDWHLEKSLLRMERIILCPHIPGDNEDLILDVVKCRFSHEAYKPCETCARPTQCHYCWTEFEIDLSIMAGNRGLYNVLITSWRCFGSGRTPYDKKWERQSVCPPSPDSNDLSQVEFEPGSIRASFGSQGLSFWQRIFPIPRCTVIDGIIIERNGGVHMMPGWWKSGWGTGLID